MFPNPRQKVGCANGVQDLGESIQVFGRPTDRSLDDSPDDLGDFEEMTLHLAEGGVQVALVIGVAVVIKEFKQEFKGRTERRIGQQQVFVGDLLCLVFDGKLDEELHHPRL